MTRPLAGIGIGMRRRHYDDLFTMDRADSIDWLEIIPENFIRMGGLQRRQLSRAHERWPIVSHGVSLSIAGPDPFDDEFLRGYKELLDELDPPFFTEHMCYGSIHGNAFHDLLPIPRTAEAVKHVGRRARELADRMERPLALENISYYAVMPGGTMDEAEFLTAVCEEADCGMLLDVNNVYVNAINHREDAKRSLDALPLDRVRQIHLAGFIMEGEMAIDNHGTPVWPQVWELYERAIRALGPTPTLIEWDTDVPPLDDVLDQLDRARAISDRVIAERQRSPERSEQRVAVAGGAAL